MAKVLKVGNLGNGKDPETIRKRKIRWGIILGVLLAVLILLNSPLFSLRKIEVVGNERVSKEAILEDLGLQPGTNLFRYALKHINQTPRMDSRISSADIYFRWPDGVRIEIEESQTIGYVYFQGTYLCIDRKGQVAASTNEPDGDLPIIKGVNVGSFSIGDTLNTTDAEKYDDVVMIGACLRKFDLSTEVKEINIRSLDNIILSTEKLDIYCGSMTDIEQKLNIVASVLEQAKDLPEGVLHVEDINSQIYVSPREETIDRSDELESSTPASESSVPAEAESIPNQEQSDSSSAPVLP